MLIGTKEFLLHYSICRNKNKAIHIWVVRHQNNGFPQRHGVAGRGPGGGFLDAGNDQCIQVMKIHQVLHLESMLRTGLLSTSFQKRMFS